MELSDAPCTMPFKKRRNYSVLYFDFPHNSWDSDFSYDDGVVLIINRDSDGGVGASVWGLGNRSIYGRNSSALSVLYTGIPFGVPGMFKNTHRRRKGGTPFFDSVWSCHNWKHNGKLCQSISSKEFFEIIYYLILLYLVQHKNYVVDILWIAKKMQKFGIFTAKLFVAFLENSDYNEI